MYKPPMKKIATDNQETDKNYSFIKLQLSKPSLDVPNV